MTRDLSNKCYDCYVCLQHVGRPRKPGARIFKGICRECAKLHGSQRGARHRQALAAQVRAAHAVQKEEKEKQLRRKLPLLEWQRSQKLVEQHAHGVTKADERAQLEEALLRYQRGGGRIERAAETRAPYSHAVVKPAKVPPRRGLYK